MLTYHNVIKMRGMKTFVFDVIILLLTEIRKYLNAHMERETFSIRDLRSYDTYQHHRKETVALAKNSQIFSL